VPGVAVEFDVGVRANGKCFWVKSPKAVMFKAGVKLYGELRIPHVGLETIAIHGQSGEKLVRFQ
jgi:hypothetical protein